MKTFFLLFVFVSVFPVCAEASHSGICSILLSSDFNETELIGEVSGVYSTLLRSLTAADDGAGKIRHLVSSNDFFAIPEDGNSALDFVREGMDQLKQVVETRFPRATPSRSRMDSSLESILKSFLHEDAKADESRKKALFPGLPYIKIDRPVDVAARGNVYYSSDFKAMAMQFGRNEIWVRKDGAPWGVLQVGQGWHTYSSFSMDKGLFFDFRHGNTLILWDLFSKKMIAQRALPSEDMWQFRVSSDGERILADGALLYTKDILSGQVTKKLGLRFSDKPLTNADPNLNYALMDADFGRHRLFDLRNGAKDLGLLQSVNAVGLTAFSPDGRYLFVHDDGLSKFDSQTGAKIANVKLDSSPFREMISFDGGQKVLYSDSMGDIFLVDFVAKKVEPMQNFIGSGDTVKFRLMRGERILAVSVQYDHKLEKTALIDMSSRTLLRLIDGALVNGPLNADENRLLIQTKSNDLQLWDLDELLEGHGEP